MHSRFVACGGKPPAFLYCSRSLSFRDTVRLFLIAFFVSSYSAHGNGIDDIVISNSVRQESLHREFSGPWGVLEVRERILELPQSNVTRVLKTFDPGTEVIWEFPNSLQEVRNIFQHSGLDERMVHQLTSEPALRSSQNPVVIRPPATLLLALTPEQRGKLYPNIGYDFKNNFYRYPLDLMPGGIERMKTSTSKVSHTILEQMERLQYKSPDGRDVFADIVLVLLEAKTEEERKALIHFISREPVQEAWLDLEKSKASRESVISYWSANGQNQRAVDLLTSAFDNPTVTKLDVSMLLPTNPGRMVNTFPSDDDSNGSSHPDCVATAMSFFEEEIPFRFVDIWEPGMLLGYEPAVPPYRLGDVFFVIDGKGFCVHAFNSVAGPLVFTKNGISRDRCWSFQLFEDVLKAYPVEPPASLECYRKVLR